MIPPLPPGGAHEGTGTAELPLRYEDVTQDGRVILTAMMHGLGASAWNAMSRALPALATFQQQGILPILRRVAIVGEGTTVSVHERMHYTGTWRFAREQGGERLFLLMWLEARARESSTFGPRPPKEAPLALVGRAFAEHVITRPFAPPAERKVTRLSAPGLPEVPELEYAFEPAEALAGGAPLDDEADVDFGLMHTDSNQHVNSLVYPRLFEEALVRRLAREGRPAKALVARAVEMRWRKPFFAGDAATIAMRTTDPTGDGGPPAKLAATGAFRPRGGDASRPSCTLSMRLA